MHIALVGHDKITSELLSKALSEGFLDRGITTDIRLFKTRGAFTRITARETFDLVCLNSLLPDDNSIVLLDWMKQYLDQLPAVIIITHRKDESDIVQALDAGADDCISKPFRPQELVARAHAALRRNHLLKPSSPQPYILKRGRIKLNTKNKTALLDEKKIVLTHQEFRLAYLLLKRISYSLSRSYLYKYAWGHDVDLQTRTLDVHIHRVRKKLCLTADNGWDLTSIYGYGYRLQKIETPQLRKTIES